MKIDADVRKRCSNRRWNNNVYKRFREGDYGFSSEDGIGQYHGQYRQVENYSGEEEQIGQFSGQEEQIGQQLSKVGRRCSEGEK